MKHYKKGIIRGLIRIPLLIWSVLVVYPLFWMIMGSFKTNSEIFASPWSLPKSFNFNNFVTAWTDFNIGSSFLNSLFVTILGTFLCLAFSIPSAYTIERIKFRGSKVLYNIYLASMMIPMVLGWIPLFFLLLKFNLLDNLWALSLVYAVSHIPFSIFILTSFIGSIPKELEESAAVDGMSTYGILFKIITPLIKTGLITVSIMDAIFFWNEYFMALIFIQTKESYTLGVAIDLMNKSAQYENTWGALFAGLSMAVIPVILIYAFLQRHIIKGMIEGAIKG
ncbi:carbohydrate ABC transporter permease [Neobacillus sp. 179-J 1A1 HS]|uniref:carbohydrate ABC transporter permease n=1 Tax=Neobacillus driksii TaxID=3035913 RepID=UPI0035BC3B55